jgi:hypothetical protein
VTLLQVIHFLMMLLTICLILGIQNFWRTHVMVPPHPEWKILMWTSEIRRFVNVCLEGKKIGCIASSWIKELCMRPPYRIISLSSKKRRSCLISWFCLCAFKFFISSWNISFWVEDIHSWLLHSSHPVISVPCSVFSFSFAVLNETGNIGCDS